MNTKIDGVSGVEDTNLRPLRRRLPLARFSLPKVRDRFRQFPKAIAECAIQTRCGVHADGLRHARFRLRSRGQPSGMRSGCAVTRRGQCANEIGGACEAVQMLAYVFHVSLRPHAEPNSVLERRKDL